MYKSLLSSAKFWLTLAAAATFTIGAIRTLAAGPSLTISSPTPNQVISANKVNVTLSVGDFQLVDYQKNPRAKLGQGHIHLWLDQSQPTKASAIKTISPNYTFDNVKPGQHTLIAELVNSDHTSLVPPVVNQVSFTTQSPTYTISQSPVLLLSIAAFISVVAALFLVSTKVKALPNSGKHAKKSASKGTKRK